MNNPYSVLGVREDASQEEIRAAYLNLVKKYHPDKYTDSDMKELANEKLKEVNEAYDMLTKRSDAGRTAESSRSYGYSGYTGSGSSYSGPNAADFARARSFINQNNLQAAKQILDSINVRNAEWYYLYGIIYLRQGWHAKASEYITNAYQQEPGNPEYSSAYYAMRNSGSTYTRSAGGGNTYVGGCSGCDVCSGLLCADCCCECMGGDLIRCC